MRTDSNIPKLLIVSILGILNELSVWNPEIYVGVVEASEAY